MTDASAFNTPLRREQQLALHAELEARLHQHGLRLYEQASSEALADLLSALDVFETSVVEAGGDSFVNTPESSQPERPEFVVPRPHDDEAIEAYTTRVLAAAAELRRVR